MAQFDNYEEWKCAMRLQLYASMLGQLILKFHEDNACLPDGADLAKIEDLIGKASDIWESTTAI